MKMKKVYGLNDRLTFGKHKDKLVKMIIRNDPEYILWCLENIDGFELDVDAEDALEWAMKDI